MGRSARRFTSPEGRRAKIDVHRSATTSRGWCIVANLAVDLLHIWTSRVETIEEPDFMFFDLDPGEECTIKTLAASRSSVRDLLAGHRYDDAGQDHRRNGVCTWSCRLRRATRTIWPKCSLRSSRTGSRRGLASARFHSSARSQARSKAVYFDYCKSGAAKRSSRRTQCARATERRFRCRCMGRG